MSNRNILFASPILLLPIILWLNWVPDISIEKMVPGMDGRVVSSGTDSGGTDRTVTDSLTTSFSSFSLPELHQSAMWAGFRGNLRSAIREEPLSIDWSTAKPVERWRIELGEGHAAPAVSEGIVYLLDYDEESREDLLRAFSLETGEEYWQRSYSNPMKRNHGYSRTVPAVSRGVVVTLGPRGHLMGVDAFSGDFLWGYSLQDRFGTEIPIWYSAQCPLIREDQVIIAPAGDDVLLAGVALETGEVIWETPPPFSVGMSHSSIITAVIGGIPQYIYSGLGGMVGVSFQGELLWAIPLDMAVIAPTPVFLPPDSVYQTAGYGAGTVLVRISTEGNGFSPVLEWSKDPREVLACEQQTPILFRDHLFGVLPKDAGPGREQFVCADRNGTILWGSTEEYRFGLGPWIATDDLFLVMNDTGTLTVAEASVDSWNPLGQYPILPGVDSWGPMALVDELLLARDSKTLVCIDLEGIDD